MVTPRVKVYKLLDVDELFKFEKLIPKLLFDLPKKKEDYFFSISAVSGWLYYSNDVEIRMNKSIQSLPINETEVKLAVKKFMQRVIEKFTLEKQNNPKFTLDSILPQNLGEPVILPVINSETRLIDHWLVKFQPVLRGTSGFGGDPIPVIGSSFEIRVGNGGKIIGMTSNWRPLINGVSELLLPSPENIDPNQSENEIPHEHDQSENEHVEDESSNFTLAYLDKGENIYQNYLTPLYLDQHGHHFSFSPASKSSIVIDIIEDHFDGEVEVFATVLGGSGTFRFEWATWGIQDMENSYVEHGNNYKLSLGIGAYNIGLTVIDQKTGIVEQMQNLTYVQEKLEVPTIDQPLV
ncbi:MAG: hypothetical protein ACJASQ_002713 [Crocinitomicaceae bacterium]|jgi:hypothetical protein